MRTRGLAASLSDVSTRKRCNFAITVNCDDRSGPVCAKRKRMQLKNNDFDFIHHRKFRRNGFSNAVHTVVTAPPLPR